MELELASDFRYRGSYISHNGSCKKDVKVGIGKAATVLGEMEKIWRNKKISLEIKMCGCTSQSFYRPSFTALSYGY